MSATLPSKWTGNSFSAVVIREDCSLRLAYARAERSRDGRSCVLRPVQNGPQGRTLMKLVCGSGEQAMRNRARLGAVSAAVVIALSVVATASPATGSPPSWAHAGG